MSNGLLCIFWTLLAASFWYHKKIALPHRKTKVNHPLAFWSLHYEDLSSDKLYLVSSLFISPFWLLKNSIQKHRLGTECVASSVSSAFRIPRIKSSKCGDFVLDINYDIVFFFSSSSEECAYFLLPILG